MLRHHPRIVVVGTSGAGKTSLARALARTLRRQHIELDVLHWGPNWISRPDFAERVHNAISADAWVLDGNYSKVREVVWARATAIVWLNYPFRLVFTRAFTRTVRRIFSGEVLFGGSRETLRSSFLDFDGVMWWVMRTYRRRRREYPELLRQPRFQHLELFELRSQAEAAALLEREGGRSGVLE